ncbi:MAG: carboxypeptidase-like regulatory domain-containing protein [Thermodesulfobacteriota bacterium]
MAPLLGALLLAAACAGPSARLGGRVMAHGEPVAGAVVALEAREGRILQEAETDADGVYRFPPVSPGEYRLTASARRDGHVWGALSGKNPVQLAPGSDAWIGLQAVPRDTPAMRDLPGGSTGFGALGGVVRFEGAAVEGAVVSLYLDEDEGLRGPGFRQSPPTGRDGAYALEEVPEGRYFVVARRRQAGGGFGPVREGDLYGTVLASPVAVEERRETAVDVHLVRKERDDDPNAELLARSGTGLRGTVRDPEGRPVAGVYVFAYRSRIVGHGMPDFLTLPTGPDGAFALSLGTGGLFYVGARERSGGSPAPGEHFGFYEGSPDHGIAVPRGRVVEGIEIVVRRVLE